MRWGTSTRCSHTFQAPVLQPLALALAPPPLPHCTNSKQVISVWHDIPLYVRDEEGKSTGHLNFVCEIPRCSRKKFEIATNEVGNPIKQDEKKGTLREFKKVWCVRFFFVFFLALQPSQALILIFLRSQRQWSLLLYVRCRTKVRVFRRFAFCLYHGISCFLFVVHMILLCLIFLVLNTVAGSLQRLYIYIYVFLSCRGLFSPLLVL